MCYLNVYLKLKCLFFETVYFKIGITKISRKLLDGSDWGDVFFIYSA